MTDEITTLLKEVNDLREAVLRGEDDIPPERYHEVLLAVRKLRRDRPEKAAAEGPKLSSIGSLLFGKVKPTEDQTP